MAYSESTAQRIRAYFTQVGNEFYEKKMFGGLCFMLDDKMCCGTHIDKDSGQDLLLCRIGEPNSVQAIANNQALPMEFTGRTMKDYVFIPQSGHSTDTDLAYWLDLCVQHNPLAQKSKKKKTKDL